MLAALATACVLVLWAGFADSPPAKENGPAGVPGFLTFGKPPELSNTEADEIAAGLVLAAGDSAVSQLLDHLPAIQLAKIDQVLALPSHPPEARNVLWRYWIQRCPDSATAYAAINPANEACFRHATAALAQDRQDAVLQALTNHVP